MTPTNSLERAFLILDFVEKAHGGARHAEIARELQIPKSSCSWILARLVRQGYLTLDEDVGRFKIGLRAVALARGALRELGFRSSAEPVLYRMASETGLAAGIGVWEEGAVLLVDRVEPPERALRPELHERPREERDVGRKLPAHTTALGKVLLAHLPRPQIESYLDQHTLIKRTSRTIVNREQLMAELRRIRQRGYAIADREHDSHLRAMAAPIFDLTGAARAALSLNGDETSDAWRDPKSLVSRITTAAAEISAGAGLRWISA